MYGELVGEDLVFDPNPAKPSVKGGLKAWSAVLSVLE